MQGRGRVLGLVIGVLLGVCAQTQAMPAGEGLGLSWSNWVEDSASYKTGSVMVRFVEPLHPAPGDAAWTGPRTRHSVLTIVADRILAGSTVERDLGAIVPGLATLRLPAGVSVQDAVARFNASPYVAYAEPNYKFKLSYRTSDAWFDSQWALDNRGQSIRVPGGTPLAPGIRHPVTGEFGDINAPEGWDAMGRGKEGDATDVIVAVLDTGVDYNHPDLQPNLWSETLYLVPADSNLADPNFNPEDPNFEFTSYGGDFVDDPPADVMDAQGNEYPYDPNVMDTHWHGTAVAGIIGATWDNTGIAGVCKNVKIVTVRITDGNEISMTTAVEGFGFALSFGYNEPKSKAHVVNCSWGTQSWPQGLYDAISGAPDVVVVGAAGNMFDDPNVVPADMDSQPYYPAGFGTAAGTRGRDALPNVISVMATDRNDVTASFSNWGPQTVHIGAPGDSILTLVPVLGTPALEDANIPALVGTPESEGVALVSGTSFAAPHVAGASALALAMNPGLSPVKLRYLMTHPSAVEPVLPGLCTSGGRLNLAKFLTMVTPGKVRNLRTKKDYTGSTPITDALKDPALRAGDEIVADTGCFYAEPTIDFKGKDILLRSGSLDGATVGDPSPDDTIIGWYDEEQALEGVAQVANQPTVNFATNETGAAVLRGFTIQDGSPGIRIGTVVIQNKQEVVKESSPRIENCIVRKNLVQGGVICTGGKAVITGCSIVDNQSAVQGGGLFARRGSQIVVTQSRVGRNLALDGWGGGICLDGGSAQVTWCRIFDNEARWQGGGVYLYDTNSPIVDCNITGNYSSIDGGGVYYDQAGARIQVRNTVLTGNRAYYYGGAIGAALTSGQVQNCLFTDNVSDGADGGAVYLRGKVGSGAEVSNCTLARNHCLPFLTRGSVLFLEGGATAQIRNTIFYDNNDVAIAEYDTASRVTVESCLFYANAQGDLRRAGRQYVVTDPAFGDLTGGGNTNFSADPMFARGRLGNYYLSNWNAGQILDVNGLPAVGDSPDPNIAGINPGSKAADANSPAIDAGSGPASDLGMDQVSTRTDNGSDTGRVDIGFHYNDPEENQTYLLILTASPSGKAVLSPTPDFQREYAQILLTATMTDPDWQLSGWTGTNDDAKRDLDANGNVSPFQWNVLTVLRPADPDEKDYLEVGIGFESVLVELRARVIGATEAGSIVPQWEMVRRGSTADLAVTLKDRNYIVRWSGTDDDLSTLLTNEVTIQPPYSTDPRGRQFKEVTARLYKPRTWVLGPGGIDRVIDDANDGDIIVVPSGRHDAITTQSVYLDRGVTLTGPNPDDPDATARTILDDYVLYITDSHVVVEGLTFTDQAKIYITACSPTIRNCRFIDCYKIGGNGSSPQQADGGNGGSVQGGAMEIQGDSMGLVATKPKIQNCMFTNCYVQGGDGGDGDNGNQDHPEGWDGGWAGYGHGGAVYGSTYADPVFERCHFEGCYAQGGSGGDGGNGQQASHGGRGGNLVWPDLIEQSMIDDWWDGWENGPYEDYWRYSGHGGAVCFRADSSPTFIQCNFNKSWTSGGLCGVGGSTSNTPPRAYRIDNFGGAVYADQRCSLDFVDCNFTYSYAAWDQEPNAVDGDDGTQPQDIYVSMGGTIAVEKDTRLNLTRCKVVGSYAAMGGAVYGLNSEILLTGTEVRDCNAYQGGGLHTSECTGTLDGVTFAKNRAEFVFLYEPDDTDPNILVPVFDPGIILTQGGAYFSESSPMLIRNSVFTDNFATSSGGAIYYSGNDQTPAESMPVLHNSLLTGNTVNRDGGAVSVDWFAKVKLSNCTITGNRAIGALGGGAGLGGGLYCGYESDVTVVDSILWKNAAMEGAQVAVTNGFEYGGRSSRLTITHTTIGPDYDPNGFESLQAAGGTAGAPSAGERLVDGQTLTRQYDSGASHVNVIVTLQDHAALRAATRWGDRGSEDALRAEMARRQQQALSKVGASDLKVRRLYQNIPAFSAAVTRVGLSRLLSDPMVAHVEPVTRVVPLLKQSLSLGNAAEVRRIHDGRGIGIAILDSGVDYTHAMLGGGGFPNRKVVGGYDVGEDDPDPMPGTVGHGTCCAGIAGGALGIHGDYVGGVAPAAGIYAIKASDANEVLFTDAELAGWDWCITHRSDNPAYPIKVISNSWAVEGTLFTDPRNADSYRPSFVPMVQAATDAGITIVAGSGNDGSAGEGIAWPSAMSGVLSVGALYDTTGRVADYSNSGATLDILAPADPMYTTDMVGAPGYDASDYFDSFNGTSSACPFVAGSVACLQSGAWERLHRYLTAEEVTALLIGTGDPVIDSKSGITTPRINLAAALDGPWGHPIRVEKGCEVNRFMAVQSGNYPTWDPAWDPNSGNLTADPLFTAGYYLAHQDAGQASDSPCLDAGSLDVSDPNVLLAGATTSTEGTPDVGRVDLGYHYTKGLTSYRLTASVVPVPSDGLPHGSVRPTSAVVYESSGSNVVTVQAVPETGYKVVKWTGTDDDQSTAMVNRVTMTRDRQVTVAFGPAAKYAFQVVVRPSQDGQIHGTVKAERLDPDGEPNDITESSLYDGTLIRLTATPDSGYELRSWSGTDRDASTALVNTASIEGADLTVTVEFEVKFVRTLTVPGEYTTIQKAVDAAGDGDVIVVDPGTYYGADSAYSVFSVYLNKPVTVTSRNPDDPCCVAATIIDGYATQNDFANRGVAFGSGAGPETVFNGFTIQNCGGATTDGEDGDRDAGHPNGYDGESWGGAGILVASGASPTIKNCVIRNCVVVGGNGGSGVDASDTQNAGRGGWAGYAWGGAAYCEPNSNPVFIHCLFEGNRVEGGNAGNGGNGQDGGGLPNWGGNYTPPSRLDIDPNAAPPADAAALIPADEDLWKVWGYRGDYRWYSGHGGAVFCDVGSRVRFVRCTIRDNHTSGGMSGVGGQLPDADRNIEPLVAFEIPSSGGGVYCADESVVTFEGCTLENNTASLPAAGADPNHVIDPYLGFGGGLAAERKAKVVLLDCNVMDNIAETGGGLYGADVRLEVKGGTVARNVALRGGGLYGLAGSIQIDDCNVVSNLAEIDPNDVGVLSSGGGAGLMLVDTSASVRNSRVEGNRTTASGGGLLILGQGSPSVFNCLITYNQANRDGGGISTNWNATPRVGSSTFVGNAAPGLPGPIVGSVIPDTGLGGALFCGYGSEAVVRDSIFFGNQAQKGTEIGVGSGFELDPQCGRVDVSYSNIVVGPNDVFADRGCVLHLNEGMLYADPVFVNGPLGPYYLSQVAAGQSRTSPCVSAGSDKASVLGLSKATTRSDDGPDVLQVDMGYHYPILQPCKFCDLVFDGQIDAQDFSRIQTLAQQWLNRPCTEGNGWCAGGDVNFDGVLNDLDVADVNACLGTRDTMAPMPNPPLWQTEPQRAFLPSSTVEMVAERSVDAWGWDVEYFFECVSGDGDTRDWGKDRRYEDRDVPSEGGATYRFKVRDALGNETEWSKTVYVRPVVVGCTPPTGALNLRAIAVDPCSVTLQGNRLIDPDGVEYFFDLETPDMNDSGWILPDPNFGIEADPNYRFAGLAPGTVYRFRYRARDQVGLCETAWSSWISVTTLPAADRIPPTPNPAQWDTADDPNGPAGWGGQPFALFVTGQGWAAQMTALAATDDSGTVEYFFDCVSDVGAWDRGFDSGWITENTYQVLIGTHPGLANLSFRVRARDAYGNMTGWSPLVRVPYP